MDVRTTRRWPETRSLSYSLRRQLVDLDLATWADGLASGTHVLDVGGTKHRKRGRFDIESRGVRVCYLNLTAEKQPDVLGDAARLPFDTATFEVALACELLEHVPEPKAVLREMVRVLKPGGQAVITVPFNYRIHADPYDYGRYTEYYWREALAEVGLEAIEVTCHGHFWTVLVEQLRSLVASWRITAIRPIRTLLGGIFWVLRHSAMAQDGRPATKGHRILSSYTSGYGLKARKQRS